MIYCPIYESPWKKCKCFQINTKVPSNSTQLDRLCLNLPNGMSKNHQLVDIAMVILPYVRESCANFEVALEIKNLFVGVGDSDVIINSDALGFYPYRIKLWIDPQLDEMKSPVNAIYEYNSRANSSTRTTSSDNEIGARFNLWALSLRLKKSWGRSLQEPMECESISVGDPGNTAKLEWNLLRWNHNGMKYNPSKPYSGLGSLKPPLRRGRTSISVEDFPITVWHLPATMASKFPLRFNLRLEADMHLVWYTRSKWVCREANCTSERVEFSREFVVADGE
ncbi:uncharacterized protein LOC112340801 [Selaginella moellendorffii]|uniref:uncharacterized protein LOC112340801 n=1 Tax=Selaginella moellendorffii TaxID=88036 RepID=UPI000D1CE567|nr:uncharacterized protein LOC112340801 [Selaginella moellendorffii]|eukprot:XP_024515597.1 uncharacterized protein LOC112340801 [Selaginella moellendorffii]